MGWVKMGHDRIWIGTDADRELSKGCSHMSRLGGLGLIWQSINATQLRQREPLPATSMSA